MEMKRLGAILLIVFGVSLLMKNFNFLPIRHFWPLILIVLGLIALYQANSPEKPTVNEAGEIIWEVNGESSFMKALIGIPVAFIVLLFTLIFLGLLGPIFLLSLLFIPFLLFFKLGWAFVRLLLPIFFAAAPFLLILWILLLLF